MEQGGEPPATRDSGHPGSLIVLKFGGSVLSGREGLQGAVHEIYRWRRRGRRVLAVVSALGGRTDALLELGREVTSQGEASAYAQAALLGNGESESAALLALHLDRSGVPAVPLTPGAVGLTGQGDATDAIPVDLDPAPINQALEDPGVVVVPGFLGVDVAGRAIHFGRGGSDTTALFLAHVLGAQRCRLVKDVPGLYESNPSGTVPPPRLYERASWDDALATDGTVLQHKAVRLARQWGRPFEVAGLNGDRASRVGPWSSVLADPPEGPERISTVLLGLGTVGGGVARLLEALPHAFQVKGAAARRPERHDDASFPVTDDPAALAGEAAPLVIEAMGGVEPARTAARAALERGAHFITANKSLLAAHGAELRSLAQETGGSVRGSATVGGSSPVLEARFDQDRGEVRAVRGVLNGTTNFALCAMEEGANLEEALDEARRRGYAEADVSRDLSGLDAAEKLCVLAHDWGVGELVPEEVEREPVDASALTCASARSGEAQRGRKVRHVATLEVAESKVRGRVALEMLEPTDPLARLEGAENGALIYREESAPLSVRGVGAGRWPTAEAVVADALDVAREREQGRVAALASAGKEELAHATDRTPEGEENP